MSKASFIHRINLSFNANSLRLRSKSEGIFKGSSKSSDKDYLSLGEMEIGSISSAALLIIYVISEIDFSFNILLDYCFSEIFVVAFLVFFWLIIRISYNFFIHLGICLTYSSLSSSGNSINNYLTLSTSSDIVLMSFSYNSLTSNTPIIA